MTTTFAEKLEDYTIEGLRALINLDGPFESDYEDPTQEMRNFENYLNIDSNSAEPKIPPNFKAVIFSLLEIFMALLGGSLKLTMECMIYFKKGFETPSTKSSFAKDIAKYVTRFLVVNKGYNQVGLQQTVAMSLFFVIPVMKEFLMTMEAQENA